MDELARTLATGSTTLPHALLVEVARAAIAAGNVDGAHDRARAMERSLLVQVVNATGVLLHTNLGRAPIAEGDPALRVGYTNLEIDLVHGRRGERARGVTDLVRLLTGAEDVLVTNNGAAAILLALAAVASGAPVAVSRGEMIEIGGGFRIPEILAVSGARLVEVGTANITKVDDYRAALADASSTRGVVLVVHRSNFEIRGFVEHPSLDELVAVGPPVIVDLGSGLLDALTPWLPGGPPAWLRREPAVRQTLAHGAALVTFSGDKLLGGPQAGFVVGNAELVARCRQHPLARALRPGRLVLAGLQETLLAYARRDLQSIPFWRMATIPLDTLTTRAKRIAESSGARVCECSSVPGGGTAPGVEIPSVGVGVNGDATDALRDFDPPILARVVEGKTVCDLRTVDPSDDALVTAALMKVSP